jgi:aminoglycoside phosphotransferase (APT) family kinase protein
MPVSEFHEVMRPMMLVDTTRYLQTILASLTDNIIPNISSEAAKSSATAVRAALLEILRRETATPSVMQGVIDDGYAIAEEISQLLRNVNSADAHQLKQLPVRTDSGRAAYRVFSACRGEFNAVTSALHDGARCLARLRSGGDVPGPASPELSGRVSALLRRITEWEGSYYSWQATAIPPLGKPEQQGAPGRFDQASLQAFIRAARDEWQAASVEDLVGLSGGMSKHTYLARISGAPGIPDACVVRRADLNPILQTDAYVLATEFELVRAVHDSGYLVAKPLLLCTDAKHADGSFYLMERMPGVMPGNYFGPTMAISPGLIENIAQLLARLHNTPLSALAQYIDRHEDGAVGRETIREFYLRKLEYWRTYIDSAEMLASPANYYALDWLLANVPENRSRPVLVHGDFNIHNMLVQDQRVTAVLDWETAGFGAPEQDLAYIQPHIAKLTKWSVFMDHYRAAGGPQIDEQTFSYYLNFALFRLLVGSNRGVRKLADGDSRDIRSTEIDLHYWPEFILALLKSTAGS